MPLPSNASGEQCNALLNLGLYNVTQTSSASDGQALSLSTFCSADYSSSSISSSQSASIQASYGLFSGGSASQQEIITKQKQLCTSGFDSSKYSSAASAYSKSVYQGSLDAWNKCQQLANQGLVFAVQPSSTMQGVSVSITAPSGLSAIFYGVTQFGSGQSTCTTMANGKVTNINVNQPFKFTAASKVTVTCTRQMQVNGNDLTADAQDLVFVTSADNLTVPLAAIGSLSRVTVDGILNKANQNTKALVQASIKSSFSGEIAAFNSNSCPTGWLPANGSNGTVDLRGEFLRGLDSGRGVDNQRVLASWQAPTLTTASIGPDALHAIVIEGAIINIATVSEFNNGMQTDNISDAWYGNSLKGIHAVGATGAYLGNSFNLPANVVLSRPLNSNSYVLYGGTRPRNVAVLYCVKI